MSTRKTDKMRWFLTGYGTPLSILLLAATGAKLIGPYGGLEVDKQAIEVESSYTEWPTIKKNYLPIVSSAPDLIAK